MVMVVEDDAATRGALDRLLAPNGYRVLCAANGREALDCLQSRELPELPAVILLDLNMPVMDGWEFRQHLRHQPNLAGICVAVLSGEWDLPSVAASLGVSWFLAKPIDPPQLLTLLREVIR